MRWAAKCILSSTLLCRRSPRKTEILHIAPPSSYSLLPSYAYCLWNKLCSWRCLQNWPLFLKDSPSAPLRWGWHIPYCTRSSWVARCCGAQSAQEERHVVPSLLWLMGVGSYKTVMVTVLHSHTGSLTCTSHGRNLYLITSVNLEKHFCLFVTKYIV